ncbi:MAG: ABC transporter permease [Pseudanabaenaceae cyanobacterium]
MLGRTFPSPEALRRFPFSIADVVVILASLILIAAIAHVGAGANVPFVPPDTGIEINLDPRELPYYAARSTLRMFIALFFSFIFTLIYGYIAANSPRAERIMIPLLDILQSVPVLGFLSITVTAFIALFPGSLWGLEAASIFAIFTSQVWNMTFSFYQSLRTVPRELQEAVTLYQLSRWSRFINLEVPASAIGLLWNAMMSFGGGWFFVAESEAISVLNQEYILPGVGSYVAKAIEAQDLRALGSALLTMIVVIVAVDQLFWRPLIAWADKFRMEMTVSAESPKSWLLDIFKAARIPRYVAQLFTPVADVVNGLISKLLPAAVPMETDPLTEKMIDRVYNFMLFLCCGGLMVLGLNFILRDAGIGEVAKVFGLGMITLVRVTVMVILSTLIWTPVGVAIGFNPSLARLLQPVVQFLAAFPANFVFPFATVLFINMGISIEIGSLLLMSLGAQWYILFNAIAGAASIPNDLREMAANVGLRGWLLWQKLIIPGIASALVTGGIAASGGAWNASIVAEIVTWGREKLVATGLGAYIAEATNQGDWAKITLGIGMMSIFVVVLNRLFWRKLYAIAETKYSL